MMDATVSTVSQHSIICVPPSSVRMAPGNLPCNAGFLVWSSWCSEHSSAQNPENSDESAAPIDLRFSSARMKDGAARAVADR